MTQRLLNASDRERTSAKKKQAAELKKAEKRKAEVDVSIRVFRNSAVSSTGLTYCFIRAIHFSASAAVCTAAVDLDYLMWDKTATAEDCRVQREISSY